MRKLSLYYALIISINKNLFTPSNLNEFEDYTANPLPWNISESDGDFPRPDSWGRRAY